MLIGFTNLRYALVLKEKYALSDSEAPVESRPTSKICCPHGFPL